MPDFKEFDWGAYKFRLLPNDTLRKTIALCGLPDFLNYFNSSDIALDLRVSIPKCRDTKNIKDTINYEWVLFTKDDKQVINNSDKRVHFYNTEGNGTFEISTSQPLKYDDGYQIMLFKSQAVNIGCLSRLEHYKVIMRFTNAKGDTSKYISMAQFTIMDKDKFRQAIFLTIFAVVATALAGIILHACGVMP
jgi:hypothetical protein